MHTHVFRLLQVVRDYPIEDEDKGVNSSWAKPIRNNRVKNGQRKELFGTSIAEFS